MKPRHLIPALLCIVLLSYPLSIGPVARMDQARHPKVWATTDGVKAFYGPLLWLVERVPKGAEILNWYIGQWLSKAEMPTD
jgi:hypothetical protein